MLGGETSSVRMPPPSPSPRSAPVYSAGGKASITRVLRRRAGEGGEHAAPAWAAGAHEGRHKLL
eukprot:scaffold75141_cov36-Phaeocystis_antarctica.AAC.3